MLQGPKPATVLFDEAHSEAWTIRPDLAQRMHPTHPADSSLARAAGLLRSRDFGVECNEDGQFDAALLDGVDVLVIAHPSDPHWERTTQTGSPRLDEAELEAVLAFVERGGGLVVLGETEQDKYSNNLNDLLRPAGIRIEHGTVQDYENRLGAPTWVRADLAAVVPPGPRPVPDLVARVDGACFYRAGYLSLEGDAVPLARTAATADPPQAPLAALATHGAGRIAVLADSDIFGDDCIGALGHSDLWLNLVYWVAGSAFAAPAPKPASSVLSDPGWTTLKEAVEELRVMQDPDGSVDTARHDAARAATLAEEIGRHASGLLPHFAHQAGYLDALRSDLAAWVDSGLGRPDFSASTGEFRPEQDRADGVEHLAVFPMYKQNASRDTCFEALVVRTAWPSFVAELEAEPYDNPKFVPIELVDATAGYDSECAVLFPETFATAPGTPANFGAILCDREAERFRRVCSAAADVLSLNLPPEAVALLSSERISRDAFVAWDLIHDRTHMRGDLPFDPFMIRQRSPYWMYALEELRCDLTAFAEAVDLERKGFAFARHIQQAILFDRLFRFPLTGSRVRNYDGLGGQLLFAFLHRERYLHWTDNRLTIDWPRVGHGVERLRSQIADLYHSGIDRPKLAQWIAAHDLVAAYVHPAPGSRWTAASRDLPDTEDPRELVDLVRDDEFPLSLFYTQLAPKLEPALQRPAAPAAPAPAARAAA